MEFSVTGRLVLKGLGTKFIFVEVAEAVLLRNRSYEIADLGRQAFFFFSGGLSVSHIGKSRKWEVREPSNIRPCHSGAVASKPDYTALPYFPN